MGALDEIFAQELAIYAEKYDTDRSTYADYKEFYEGQFKSHWRQAMAADMQPFLGNTKTASIARQLARYDQGTRGIGPKYAAAMQAAAADLPPIRKIPEGKMWRVSATIYVNISNTKGTRTASATFSNLDSTLHDLLEEYAKGGTMDVDEWEEAIDGLGSISIEEM